MKLYLIKEFSGRTYLVGTSEALRQVLPVNNWYEGELTPTIYDPQTLQPAPPAYIVKCSDGKFRKVGGEYFLTQEQWRERQLIELGI